MWEFNIHTSKTTLSGISNEIFKDMNVSESIPKLDMRKVHNYVRALESHYPSTNPFHNAIHAADVGQSMYSFLRQDFASSFTPLEKFALVLAAFAHDVGHNGKNNDFLIKTQDPMATRFEDQSPLENYHLCLARKLLEGSEVNFLCDLEPHDQERFQAILEKTILGTDNALHFSKLKRFKAMVEEHDGVVDKDFLMEVLLHAADISNPCKLYEHGGPYKVWCDSVMAEFYALGDLERKHGLPPTELFQRSKPVDEVQIGFTSFFVRPLYEALGQVKGFDATGMLANIDCNLAYWQRVKTARESPRVESSQTVTECGKRTKRRRRNAMVFSMLGKETVDFLQTLVEG